MQICSPFTSLFRLFVGSLLNSIGKDWRQGSTVLFGFLRSIFRCSTDTLLPTRAKLSSKVFRRCCSLGWFASTTTQQWHRWVRQKRKVSGPAIPPVTVVFPSWRVRYFYDGTTLFQWFSFFFCSHGGSPYQRLSPVRFTWWWKDAFVLFQEFLSKPWLPSTSLLVAWSFRAGLKKQVHEIDVTVTTRALMKFFRELTAIRNFLTNMNTQHFYLISNEKPHIL